jgi:hypothetical protein
MRSTVWVSVAGRSIKLYSWVRQSVNICDANNCNGQYERRYFFMPGFHVTPSHLTRFQRLDDLFEWLSNRSYRQLV